MWFEKPKTVTVLLVEDDDVDAMSFKRSLAKQNVNNPIVRASDGLEALEVLKNGGIKSPYIVILDLQMPRMSGHEFLKEIRADAALSSSVVFVLTTSSAEQDIENCYKSHVAGYFVKDEAANQFMGVISLLKDFWRIVELPFISAHS